MPRKLSILPLVIAAPLTACTHSATASEIEALRVCVTDSAGAPLPSFPVRVKLRKARNNATMELGAPLLSDEHGLLQFLGVSPEAARFHAIAIELCADVVVRDPQFVAIDLTRRLESQYTIRVPENGLITVDLKCALADRLGVSGKGRVTVLRPERSNDYVSDHGHLPGRDFKFEGPSILLRRVALNASFWVWLQPEDHALAVVVVAEGPRSSGELAVACVECGASETLLRARLFANGAPLKAGELVRWTIACPETDGAEEPRGYRLGNCNLDGDLDIVINTARVPEEALIIGYEWESDGQARRGSVTVGREELAAGPVIDMGSVKLE